MVQHILNQFVPVLFFLSEVLCSLLCSVFELVSAYGTVGLSLGIPDVGLIQTYHAFADRRFSKTILFPGNLTL